MPRGRRGAYPDAVPGVGETFAMLGESRRGRRRATSMPRSP
ncbi:MULTISPECIES: hypothetical protein [Streptosporangium]|uniref:K+-sensing histidine kinase KdpD n=1 Tax=Streptosporangium brasiliense TaxID=47480 RepID=A0ABT9R4I0_9ACTN|nr:hypothetical protein [Streptosporangium brasiliense]MDP9864138.1 K+-sensing histidine kinase KdpD [Streptosporangium brasiliense]